jgi:hypothetical protein
VAFSQSFTNEGAVKVIFDHFNSARVVFAWEEIVHKGVLFQVAQQKDSANSQDYNNDDYRGQN